MIIIYRRSDGSVDTKIMVTMVDIVSVKLVEPAIELTQTSDDQRLAWYVKLKYVYYTFSLFILAIFMFYTFL